MLDDHLHSLDDTFLFLISSVNIVFAALQVSIAGSNSFILFSPLLVTGLFYPFYTGYVRGVVQRGPLVERIRGWIYFGVGVITYLSMLPVALLRDFYPEAVGVSLAPYVLVCLIEYYGIPKLVRWLLLVTNVQPSKRELLLLGATALSAYFLSSSTFFMQDYIRLWILSPKTDGPAYLTAFSWILGPFSLFLLIERTIKTALPRDDIVLLEIFESDMPLAIAFNGSAICLVNGLLANTVALWLGILSYALFTLTIFFSRQIQFWLQLVSLILALLALAKFAKSPINVIETQEQFRDRVRQILRVLDCSPDDSQPLREG